MNGRTTSRLLMYSDKQIVLIQQVYFSSKWANTNTQVHTHGEALFSKSYKFRNNEML